MKKQRQSKFPSGQDIIEKMKKVPVVPDKGKDGKPDLAKLAVELATRNHNNKTV